MVRTHALPNHRKPTSSILLGQAISRLYRQQLTLHFAERLRDEQKFDGIEPLVAQIKRDISRTRVLLDAGEKSAANNDTSPCKYARSG